MPINLGRELDSLHNEADKLRKDAHHVYTQALSGKLSKPGTSQDYLMTLSRILLEVAFAIEEYSMRIQGKHKEWNIEEIKNYRELIQRVRSMLS